MEAEMRTDGLTGGAAKPQGFKAKLICQSQRRALDNPLASKRPQGVEAKSKEGEDSWMH
jgi:hypothetical protein